MEKGEDDNGQTFYFISDNDKLEYLQKEFDETKTRIFSYNNFSLPLSSDKNNKPTISIRL